MEKINSSKGNRNLLWLNEQQEKLRRRSPSPKPLPAPKPTPQPEKSFAFSNPIYDEYSNVAPIKPSPSTEPDDQKKTAKPEAPPKPVPKPRKSLAATPSSCAVVAAVAASHAHLKPEVSVSSITSSSSSSTTSSFTSVETPEVYVEERDEVGRPRLDTTASDSVHSFLYFEEELPAKMNALINELESLAESLASSDPEDGQLGGTLKNVNKDSESFPQTSKPVPAGTFRRKRIQVQKDLFKFSFSSGSDTVVSPAVTPDIPPASPLDKVPVEVQNVKQNTDSGVFSGSGSDSAQNENFYLLAATAAESVDLSPPETKRKSSIPKSPPPKLPPRKHSVQYEKEPRAIEIVSPPVQPPSTLSSSGIPKKPPPPIPQPSPKKLTPQKETSSSESSSSSDQTPKTDLFSVNLPIKSPSPPKPPQPPTTPLAPLFLNSEVLSMEHLHISKLSLQRSGYLWKTGPNFKAFKYRWCILHRHNLDLADASFSYYFNRNSISASLSGKIMISEIEFVAVCDAVPAKTRLPKLEKSQREVADSGVKQTNQTTGSSSVVFLEVGVRSSRSSSGRVYLLAARATSDRQLWMHAFSQALSLHAFKNKELTVLGFLRAKWTVSCGGWMAAFALLTGDRFLYVFELEVGSPVRAINCKTYQVYNLRKTVRIAKLDEAGGALPVDQGSSSGLQGTQNTQNSVQNLDCKYGFCVTQNGGRVVYLIADQPEHSSRWYRSVLKLWPIPDDPPSRCTLEEQYLTRENIPVAVDKCLKYLDTYSTVAERHHQFFNAHPLFANIEQQHPLVIANSTRLLAELRGNAWAVHLLPKVHSAQQVSLLLLLFLRSLAQCVLTEEMLPTWMELGEELETAEADADSASTEFSELLEAVKEHLHALPPIHYATLRRVVLCLANVHMQYPLSTSLCKALVFSKKSQSPLKTALPATEGATTTNLNPVSVTSARTLLTTFIKHHLFLFEVTKEEVDREMHIKRVVHLMITQRTDDMNVQQQQQPTMVNLNCGIGSLHHLQPTMPISNKPALSSAGGGGPPLTVIDTKQVNSLIIGIKVVDRHLNGVLEDGKGEEEKERAVLANVHLNRQTTAADVLDMVLQKSELKEHDRSEYALFEVVCYRRLERLVGKAEPVLPIVLSWNSWPSHWCAEAALEVRHPDSLMRGSLALLHNRSKYQHLLSSSSGASPTSAYDDKKAPPSGGNQHSRLNKRTSQSMKARPTVVNGEGKGTQKGQPGMLMSVIRYCGQNDTRLARSILAEFSSSSLFLYSKESHQLIGQYGFEDLLWYVGLESASLVVVSGEAKNEQQGPTGSTSNVRIINSKPTLMVTGVGNGGDGRGGRSEQNVAALTILDRRLQNVCQSRDRLNFGQTLLFSSWNELYQWIRALMTASEKGG